MADLQLATFDDVGTLLDMMQAFYDFEGLSFIKEKAQGAAIRLIEEHSLGRIWLIRHGGQIVGYLAVCFGFSLEFGGCDAFIDEFFILEQYRWQGLGKSVLAIAESALKEMDIQALHLEVLRDDPAGRNFYSQMGFESREHFVLMSKYLAD